MHGKGERTEAAHARAARASEGHGRALLPGAFLLALVALLLLPTRAYADGANYRTVLWSGDVAGGKQYIVGADNKYDAAAYICGQTSAQVAAYDLTVRYKLSATENDFASLADSLEKDWPAWNEDTLSQSLSETFSRDVNGISLWQEMTSAVATTGTTVGLKPFGTYLDIIQVDYWQRNVDCDIYAVDTTADAVSRAMDDLQEILNGGGGTSGGVFEGFPETFVLSKGVATSAITSHDYSIGVDGVRKYPSELGDLVLTVSYDGTDLPQGEFDVVGVIEGTNATNIVGYSYIYLVPRGTFELTEQDGKSAYVNTSGIQQTIYRVYSSTGDAISNVGGTSYQFSCNRKSTEYKQPNGTLMMENGTRPRWYITNVGGGTPDPDPPSGPGNWPDTPTNPNPDPEPPTVPDPPENPEPDPPSTPTAPTPPPLEPPTNVTIPTGTTPQDYTPWLRAILEQLQTLTDELASHCVHLQEEMQTSVNELQDTLIYRFNSLESQIWDLFNGLEDYMHDLAEWLAEQLDFNVNTDPYDDSSVLYWLRQIYSRLGNLPKSPTTVMDPDPTEPFDFWAWLMNLIANTVGGIIGDLVGDVAGLLDLFKDKFPFSIPWDIAALLTLLDGTRATPAFDVKIAAVQGWWQETTFRIDLSPFDSVASACRTMVNILWVMVLVMKTDWMLAIMGDATSFGERFARKVARTS